MDIQTLRYFLAIVREENISRAAETAFISQPALSRRMAQLEEELGVQLFERGKRLRLTDAGVTLSKRATEVVEMVEKIKVEFTGGDTVSGIISIGMGGLIASQQMLGYCETFQRQYPQVEFQFFSAMADDIKEKLDTGLLDFGVLLEPVEINRYDYLRFNTQERWGLLMSSENPLAEKTYITPQDLNALPLITSNRYALQKELEHWLQADNVELNIVATYNLINHITTLVARNYASALTIEGATVLLDHSRLTFRPLQPELVMTSVLAWKKTHKSYSTAAKFFQFVKEQL